MPTRIDHHPGQRIRRVLRSLASDERDCSRRGKQCGDLEHFHANRNFLSVPITTGTSSKGRRRDEPFRHFNPCSGSLSSAKYTKSPQHRERFAGTAQSPSESPILQYPSVAARPAHARIVLTSPECRPGGKLRLESASRQRKGQGGSARGAHHYTVLFCPGLGLCRHRPVSLTNEV